MGTPYSVAFHTLGCKVSQYETEALREEFLRRGFREVPFESPADVYVINTCTVTAESDRKSRQMIRRATGLAPDALVFVVGCYSQVSPNEVVGIPGVAYVGGSGNKMKVPEEAEKMLRDRDAFRAPTIAVTDIDKEPFEPMTVKESPRTRAYLKIEDGCECRCTYCAIPGARGVVRSKSPDDVLSELRVLAENGTREVVLTGIETASYGAGTDFRLIDLLTRIERESPIERVRLGSLTPELFRPDFIERIAAMRKPVPHFHISMQSGSSAVLRAMHRRYNAEQAINSIHALRDAFPRLMLTTDMMVGFPGETEENFTETVAFSRDARFLAMHVFAYSPRKDTPAATYPDQVEESVKRDRAARLAEVARELTAENLKRTVEAGVPLPVLFETDKKGVAVGHSDSFIEFEVKSDVPLHGEILTICPQALKGDRILGELVK